MSALRRFAQHLRRLCTLAPEASTPPDPALATLRALLLWSVLALAFVVLADCGLGDRNTYLIVFVMLLLAVHQR